MVSGHHEKAAQPSTQGSFFEIQSDRMEKKVLQLNLCAWYGFCREGAFITLSLESRCPRFRAFCVPVPAAGKDLLKSRWPSSAHAVSQHGRMLDTVVFSSTSVRTNV